MINAPQNLATINHTFYHGGAIFSFGIYEKPKDGPWDSNPFSFAAFSNFIDSLSHLMPEHVRLENVCSLIATPISE